MRQPLEMILIEATENYYNYCNLRSRLKTMRSPYPDPQDPRFEKLLAERALANLIPNWVEAHDQLSAYKEDLSKLKCGKNQGEAIQLYKDKLNSRIRHLYTYLNRAKQDVTDTEIKIEADKIRGSILKDASRQKNIEQKLQFFKDARSREARIFSYAEILLRTGIKEISGWGNALEDREKLEKTLSDKVTKTQKKRAQPSGDWRTLLERLDISLMQTGGLGSRQEKGFKDLKSDVTQLLKAIGQTAEARQIAEWKYGVDLQESFLALEQDGLIPKGTPRKRRSTLRSGPSY